MPKSKLKKFRGSRTCGGGTHKNRRGAGSRGGRGNAGCFKHHVVRTLMRGQRQGKYGFHRPNAKKIDVINVGVLDQMVGEDGRIDLSGKKVLGDGRITRKLIVSAANFSRSAKEKIEAAGGEVVVT